MKNTVAADVIWLALQIVVVCLSWIFIVGTVLEWCFWLFYSAYSFKENPQIFKNITYYIVIVGGVVMGSIPFIGGLFSLAFFIAGMLIKRSIAKKAAEAKELKRQSQSVNVSQKMPNGSYMSAAEIQRQSRKNVRAPGGSLRSGTITSSVVANNRSQRPSTSTNPAFLRQTFKSQPKPSFNIQNTPKPLLKAPIQKQVIASPLPKNTRQIAIKSTSEQYDAQGEEKNVIPLKSPELKAQVVSKVKEVEKTNNQTVGRFDILNEQRRAKAAREGLFV